MSKFRYPGKCLVTEAQAKKLHNANIAANDPFPKIKPGLLSSDAIIDYVQATGMIAPFYVKRDNNDKEKTLLKMASYEGRVGKRACRFNDCGQLEDLLYPQSKSLIIPGDTIIFVESDLYFRIPNYIAMRFNLSITHVHRGLLLGTGPLIDPGYNGKLCIPVHNLTSEDHEIRLDDGLFWVEFTKVSGKTAGGRLPLEGKKPEYKDIEYFIRRAAVDLRGKELPIVSSIPKAAKSAKESAENAERSVELIKSFIFWGGFISAVAVIASLFAIVSGYYKIVETKIEQQETEILELNKRLDEFDGAINDN